MDPASAGPHPILGDPAVRRAFTQAIDADRLMNDLYGSETAGEVCARRAVGTISPSLCGMHADGNAPLPYDPAAARAALEEAGWKDADGDGIREKGGRPLELRLLTSSGNPQREAIAVTVQAQLKEIGVQVEIETLEFGAYVERAMAKDFDAIVGAWSMDFFVDPSGKWHSGPGHTWNFVSYGNERADALIEQGLAQPDAGAAAETWREFQQVVFDDQPYTFLWWTDEVVAVHQRFEDVQVDLLSPVSHPWSWWVPADQVKYTE